MFFFQAEDGIRDLVRSRGLGDVYKRQGSTFGILPSSAVTRRSASGIEMPYAFATTAVFRSCLLYTSDAADERSSVDLGGRRIINKKKLTVVSWRTASSL